MRFFATSVALAFIAAVVQAAPAPVPNPYNTPFQVRITFIGAAGAEFVQFFPGDGSVEPISMSQDISPSFDLTVSASVSLHDPQILPSALNTFSTQIPF